ncbi:MFS transporter, DHA1 family, arabinose polymer transporter [Maribacter sedimenticola]|uniref:MFS transporter, DHA1 family, arabinose polymer transporter n=1 Tax=Maribacter sedimenticola TaxID=228956 RepID=A0ABY1SJD9_9FLAO|nr:MULTISPECIES: MFS transporter [Maribacter]TVZ14033.1 DHA1 family arabinose polymer transporter-like MFS transporter [Maribacter sp. MAR_2009_72]SNR64000.1 MFS transporter, DHA1 family, arabinose polymer transporter [Maribacter sedimenticola]
METIKSNKKALFALAIGGFGIGLTEFVIMGILTEVSGSLGITIPQAGHFIAAYALGVVVGAPLLTGMGAKLSPKKMLFLLMIWFTVFNTLSGLASGYSSLLFLRFLSGIPHGAFFGIGAVVATKLAKKGKAAQAISIMFSGLTVANVIGVPIGTYLGQQFSWSVSFYLVGFVGLLALGSIYLWMPKIEVEESSEKVTVAQGLKNTELWALIALTTIGTGGFFAWYSYVAPLITNVAGLPEHFVGYAMMLAGLGMVAGNFLGAKMAELLSPLRAVIISLSMMCAILLANMVIATNPYLLMVMTFVIGAISFTVATPIQMAIINTSKGSEMLGSSMNQSAFNMGNASGAYLAGLPMAFGYGILYSSLVGALLAFSGVMIAVAILLVRKRRAIKYRKMAISC